MNKTASIPETDKQAERLPLTKKQRKSKKNRRRWLERLTETWPQAFDLKTPRPLAIGIIDAITAELNKGVAGGYGAARYALKGYTSDIRYIRALVAGGPRDNLHGAPEGEVTAEQQQRAADAIALVNTPTPDPKPVPSPKKRGSPRNPGWGARNVLIAERIT